MDDVRAVMDAAGSDRAVLFGYSEGGPLSVLFAATYPERVLGLVLVGCLRQAHRSGRRLPLGTDRARRGRRSIERLAEDWGYRGQLGPICPSGDEAMARWWGERCRAAASPGAAGRCSR